jgi:hypothetical protein
MAGDREEKCCSRSALGSERRGAGTAAEPGNLFVQFCSRLRSECAGVLFMQALLSVLSPTVTPERAVCMQVWFAVGAPLLLAMNLVVDKIIFPHVSIEDEIHLDLAQGGQSDNNDGPGGARNWGIALVAGTVAISMAQLLNTFLRDCAFEFGVH